MTSRMIVVAAESAGSASALPVPAWVYGAVALVVFSGLLLVTFAFANVSHRH
jgi:hypothetical protein